MQLGAVPQAAVAAKLAVASGATDSTDLDVTGADRLTVFWRLKATVTVGDMTLNALKVYAADKTTLLNLAITPAVTIAPTVGGADVWAMQSYDLRGVQKVNLSAKNNNAGALNLDVHTFTS